MPTEHNGVSSFCVLYSKDAYDGTPQTVDCFCPDNGITIGGDIHILSLGDFLQYTQYS